MSKKHKLKTAMLLVLLVAAGETFSDAGKGRTFFRYTNDQGVRVLNHTIPPEYAQLGYEVVNASGQVIRTVPPAPSAEELAEAEAQREAKARFNELRKRYKSVEEIELAQQRRLASINTNIAILKANIHAIDSQLNQLFSQAAGHEREGRSVPANLLEKIDVAQTEKSVATASLEKRQEQYHNVEAQFDQDIAAFRKGLAMLQQ